MTSPLQCTSPYGNMLCPKSGAFWAVQAEPRSAIAVLCCSLKSAASPMVRSSIKRTLALPSTLNWSLLSTGQTADPGLAGLNRITSPYLPVLRQFVITASRDGPDASFPTIPTLRPKLRNVPRRSFSMAMAFDCSSLRWVSSIRSFWLCRLAANVGGRALLIATPKLLGASQDIS